MPTYLDFEQPIAELEGKIEELRHLPNAGDLNIAEEVARLQQKADKLLRQIYGKLSPWQKTLVARHVDRPHFSDYVAGLIEDYTPLAGDRLYADDRAIQGGLGRFRGRSVLLLGHEKGTATTRMQHNWGMAKPEGYRKAQRLMEVADRFNLPLLAFVDTPGAHPGVEAEARGQAEAIARSIEVCLKVRIPSIAAIIGEGGSGGAIALAAANRVLMLEHAVYSVISAEGCASILWRDADHAKTAAQALRLTADDLKALGVIDEIIAEPLGGAHRNHQEAIDAAGNVLAAALAPLLAIAGPELCRLRRERFLAIGQAL
jgi:acetyl-CoA carboxylase carboxyl transferase subunit alpha